MPTSSEISFTISFTILFLNLFLLCTTISGFNYTEPPDSPIELNRRGQVEATSCGLRSYSDCVSSSGCRSGRIQISGAEYVLKNILSNCTEDSIPNGLPSSAEDGNGKIRITSTNRADCVNIDKSVGSTDNPGVSFWIYTESRQPCYLFEVGGVQVKISSLYGIAIRGSNSRTVDVVENKKWRHVYIRSESSAAKSSLFINGKYAEVINSGLPRNPSNITLNIGCDDLSMVDFRFYKQYLSNREIKMEIFMGLSLTDTPISFPQCRCPPSNPVLVMSEDDPSGVFCEALEGGTRVSRLSDGMVDSLRDGKSLTYWKGSAGSQTITFMFDQVFMIDNVTLSFLSGSRSESVTLGLFVNDTEKNTDSISISSDSVVWIIRKSPPSENSIRSEVEKMVANKIEITLNSVSDVNISKISIMGRCYCNGNSEISGSCNITGRNFKCRCQSNSRRVTGDSCEQCQSNLYREEEDFGCNKSCSCYTKGTEKGKQHECEQVGGQCTCKSNVGGRTCNTCKPLYYNLTDSNPSGCNNCNCGAAVRECNKLTGSCTCKQNVETSSGRCLKCNFGFYGASLDDGCKNCSCSTSGVIGDPRNCSDSDGQCNCKQKVKGLKCDECVDKYYNLTRDNSEGCSPCQCNKVGRLNEICSKGPSGMCRCRGNASLSNKRNCDPVFEPLKLIPDFGPISGNTTVAVTGRLFGDGSVVTSEVAVGSIGAFKPFTSVSDERLTFITPFQSTVGKVSVTLRWAKVYEVGTEKDFTKEFQFEYRPNPSLKPDLVQSLKAFKKGGCKIPIRGTNLDSVSQPMLIVYNESGIKLKTEQCSVSSSTEILCNSPSGFNRDTVLRFGVQLDGTTMYENNNTFPNAQIKIVKDPVPTQEVEEKQEYRPIFAVELQIEGQEFTTGCADSDFKVKLKGSSNSYPCLITSRERNLIKCEPDIGFPGVDEEVEMMLYIGGHEYNIQRVTLYKFWSTWQFILIAVGGSLFILLVILLPIILCCLCRSKKVQINNNENGLLVKEQPDAPALDLNEIGLDLESQNHPRARPNSYEGVQLEKECWSNFIHKINQSVRKMLNASHMEKSDIVVGTRCIKKGNEIRIVDGSFAHGTGKPYAGRPAMFKTLVNSYSNFETDLLPDWVNTGLQECLRFRDAFDENILQTKGIATDKDRFYITYPGYKRSLKDYLSDKSIVPTIALLLDKCVQILEGIQFLHNIDIVHKDLAARNCVVCDNDTVQVTDAAFSWNLYPEEYMYDNRREKYLPVRWMAPESLAAGFYDKSSDVWSFGVLVWEVTSLCLYLPYHEVTEDAKIQNHVDAGFILGKPENATNALYDEVMMRCWDKQSSHRLKVSEIGDKFDQILNPDSANDPTELYVNNTSELQTDNIYTNYAFQ